MRSRLRLVLLALGLGMTLVAGCSADDGRQRRAGDPVTEDEAQALAQLLHRNFRTGGADFVVTAPYSDDTVLTLTGEVDFRQSVGRAQAVISFGDDRVDDVATLFFTPDELWVGEAPGLAEALADAGVPAGTYVRRPVTVEGDEVDLVDVLVRLVVGLSARTADDPQAFRGGGYTWEGQRSIDSRLTSLFGLQEGRTVAVASSTRLLIQYVTPLQDGDFDVTVTLSDHGPRAVAVPEDAETVEAADHPGVARTLGL